jgi:hypothetical protein
MNLHRRFWRMLGQEEQPHLSVPEPMEPLQPGAITPSARIRTDGHIWTIEAWPAALRFPGPGEEPMVYLSTSCLGIAEYCFLGQIPQHGGDWPGIFAIADADRLEIHLRMKRCGAVVVRRDRLRYDYWGEMYGDGALVARLEKAQYVFGWPASVESRGVAGESHQPVWVYHIWRKRGRLELNSALYRHGMEGQLQLNWLMACPTMEEYCERLRIHGAVYFNDVRKCSQARELRLVG